MTDNTFGTSFTMTPFESMDDADSFGDTFSFGHHHTGSVDDDISMRRNFHADNIGSSRKSKYIFHGELENIRSLIPVFKAITIKKIAVMAITDRGIKISCEEDARTVQATAFIDRNMFRKYEMKSEHIPESLCFPMADFLNALSILFPNRGRSGNQVNSSAVRKNSLHGSDHDSEILRIKYESVDRLKLQVICGDHAAMAYIQTFLPIQLVVFTMPHVNKIIIDASVLIDFWKCADAHSPMLEIKMDNNEPWFEMATDSDRGRFVNRIKAQSIHIEHYECTVPMVNRYAMHSMQYTVKPLLLASKVSLRFDSNGLLNMQFLIRLDTIMSFSDLPGDANRQRHQRQPPTAPLGTKPVSGDNPSQASFSTQNTVSQEIPKCFIEYYIVPSINESLID